MPSHVIRVLLGSQAPGHGTTVPLVSQSPGHGITVSLASRCPWDHGAQAMGSRWWTPWCPACSTPPALPAFRHHCPLAWDQWWGDTRQCLGLTYGDQASLPASLNCTLISLAIACAGDGAAHALGHTRKVVLGLPRSGGECLSPTTMLTTACAGFLYSFCRQQWQMSHLQGAHPHKEVLSTPILGQKSPRTRHWGRGGGW